MMTAEELHDELDRREADLGREYIALAGSRDLGRVDKLWEEEKFIENVRDVLSELEGENQDEEDFVAALLKDARRHHAEKCSLLSGDGPCDCVVTDLEPIAAAPAQATT